MAVKWHSTKYPGVRYREHATRKHGVKMDRYFSIRYQKNGKRKEEGLGWATQGWTVQKAAIQLAELKNNQLTGSGPIRMKEKREQAEAEKRKAEDEKKQKELDSITFSRFFGETYFPQAKQNKSASSWKREEQFNRLWIGPVIGEKPLKEVSPLDLERIKRQMSNAGRSPRSIHYCLAVIRQVYNVAKFLDIHNGDNPVSRVKKPKNDNKRLRFLTHEEADRLLENLMLRSRQLHDMALISLHCGLRAGELFKLTWQDVDMERGLLTLRDTKGGVNRYAFMTKKVKEVLRDIDSRRSDLVFPNRNGKPIQEISNAFGRAVRDLGLNDGITDDRYKVCFHSLRHTFASWHVEGGTDLYTVKKLMGHSTIDMTERYAHLGTNTLQDATANLEKSFEESTAEVIDLDQKKMSRL